MHYLNGCGKKENHTKPLTTKNADKDSKAAILGSENNKTVTLKRIGPGEHYCTLGVYISSNGDYSNQVEVLKRQINTWSGAQVVCSALTKWYAIRV